jgi:glycosyltransferase involved in cell wall biosynthesis
MKILHLISALAPRYGGPSKACVEMAIATAKLGHDVSIYTTNIDGPKDLKVPLHQPIIKGGVKIFHFPVQSPRFWKFSLPLFKKLNKTISNFDLVHIHSLYLFPNLIGGYLCRKYQIPYIIRPHGTLDPFLHKHHRYRKKLIELLFENRNLKNAAAIHYTTEEEMKLAQAWTFSRPGIIVPNGVNIEDYSHLPKQGFFREKFPETLNKKIILFLGRLNFKKGLDLLVTAFINLAKKDKNIHLVFAGPDCDNLGIKLKQQIKNNELEVDGNKKRVTFTGLLGGKIKLAALNDSDIFVLPSYTENFGISVVEAMACKKPVIISDKVNIWREVKKDKAGLIGPCDARWFEKNIKFLLMDYEKQLIFGKNGLKSAKKRYTWTNIAKKLESEYKRILEGKQK